MQYYTKQQLQGAGKFSSPCRNGNWNEDDTNEEHLLKDYLQKKGTGKLKLNTLRFRMERALDPATPSVIANDGVVHFGDLLQVHNLLRDVVLSIDTEDRDPRPTEHSCNVAASKDHTPRKRNTFLLAKYKPPKQVYDAYKNSGEVLHYGQKFYLIANPEVNGDEIDDEGGIEPWFVRSTALSNTHFSKLARHQEICLTNVKGYDGVWQVATTDPATRFKNDGQPVKVGAPLLFEHCNSKQHLLTEDSQYWNEFGYENEVTCHSTARFNRIQVLKKMTEGTPNDLLKKSQEEDNHWSFVPCSNVARLKKCPGYDNNYKALMVKLSRALSKHGVNGIMSLKKCFDSYDVNSSRQLDGKEFECALRLMGISVTKEEMNTLLELFDKNKTGTIDFKEFSGMLEEVDRMT